MTSAGNLRFRVSFQKKTPQDDGGGATLGDWAQQFVRWAAIQPLRGGETVQAERLTGTQPVLIIVRADSETRTITTGWRAVETLPGGAVRYYGLKTAEDMLRDGEFLTLLAVAGDPDGR